MSDLEGLLSRRIRLIPDWPVPGVLFRDITPVLADPEGLPTVVSAIVEALDAAGVGPVDMVAGIEARGFVFGAPLAVELGVGFVPVRKAGKLPGDLHSATYDLEYGTATLEIQVDALASGHRVVLVDDVVTTSATVRACSSVLRAMGASSVDVLCVARGGKGAES